MTDYLKGIKEICTKYYDNDCEGCPFQYGDKFNLECDSGVYKKSKWDIDKLKQVIDNELDGNQKSEE